MCETGGYTRHERACTHVAVVVPAQHHPTHPATSSRTLLHVLLLPPAPVLPLLRGVGAHVGGDDEVRQALVRDRVHNVLLLLCFIMASVVRLRLLCCQC